MDGCAGLGLALGASLSGTQIFLFHPHTYAPQWEKKWRPMTSDERPDNVHNPAWINNFLMWKNANGSFLLISILLFPCL